MKLFEWQNCGQLLFSRTPGASVADTSWAICRTVLSALAEEEDSRWRALAAPERPVRFCANAAYGACNWLVPAEAPDAFCQACRLNRTIPDLGPPDHARISRVAAMTTALQ